MPRVAVVTDSVICLPKELVKEYGIRVVPVDVIFEDKAYRDGIDITPSEFYPFLKKAKKLPTTSAPSPGTFLEVYRELSQKASDILCVTVSSKISVVFRSAWQAMEIARESIPQTTINVLDSCTAAGAEGFIAVVAARAAAAGQSIAQVTEAAENMVARVNLIVMMDTLYYLAKGGRIPKAAAWAGSILSIKPILHFTEGELSLLERARTKRRGVERLIAIVRERVGTEQLHINIHHGNVPDEAEKFKQRISSQFDCAELYITDFTPVMGTHTGPGLLGLAFYGGD